MGSGVMVSIFYVLVPDELSHVFTINQNIFTSMFNITFLLTVIFLTDILQLLNFSLSLGNLLRNITNKTAA